MPAATTDKITDTRLTTRPVSTTASGTRSAGGTSLACTSLTGWPTASKVHFVTYQIDTNSDPVAGTQLDCSGIVSGNTIGSFTVLDGTDTGNVTGDVVEMLPTSYWAQDLSDALLVSLDRTGALKSGITITSPTLVTPALGTPASGVATNLTGTAASLTAGQATDTVTKTGTGSTYVTNTSPTIASATLTSPTLTAPALGTPASGVATNLTGTATALNIGGNAATVTTNANLTGEVTSTGNTATIAADAVDASNLLNGQVYRRQGGSSTVWDSAGTSTYDVSSTDVKIQAGCVQGSSSGLVTVTFPVAYTYTPLIIATSSTAVTYNTFPVTSAHGTTSFDFHLLDVGGTRRAEFVNWIAIGV